MKISDLYRYEICPSFGFLKSSGCEIPSSEKIKVLLENVKYLDEDAFDTDSNLLNELIQHEGFQESRLGLYSFQVTTNASFVEETYWYELIGQVFQLFTAMTLEL